MTMPKKEYVFDKWYKSLTKEERDNLYNDCRSETKRKDMLYYLRLRDISIFDRSGDFKAEEQLNKDIENLTNTYNRIFDKFITYYEKENKQGAGVRL